MENNSRKEIELMKLQITKLIHNQNDTVKLLSAVVKYIGSNLKGGKK